MHNFTQPLSLIITGGTNNCNTENFISGMLCAVFSGDNAALGLL